MAGFDGAGHFYFIDIAMINFPILTYALKSDLFWGARSNLTCQMCQPGPS